MCVCLSVTRMSAALLDLQGRPGCTNRKPDRAWQHRARSSLCPSHGLTWKPASRNQSDTLSVDLDGRPVLRSELAIHRRWWRMGKSVRAERSNSLLRAGHHRDNLLDRRDEPNPHRLRFHLRITPDPPGIHKVEDPIFAQVLAEASLRRRCCDEAERHDDFMQDDRELAASPHGGQRRRTGAMCMREMGSSYRQAWAWV